LGRRTNTSPVAAIKSNAIESGTSGLSDPVEAAPIALVGGGVVPAPPTPPPFGVRFGVGRGVTTGDGLGDGLTLGLGLGDGLTLGLGLGDGLTLGLGLGDGLAVTTGGGT
jgi:hypothetical protein